jgi:hypothetical protein
MRSMTDETRRSTRLLFACLVPVAAFAAAGCSTGKPRPAKIKTEYIQPDTSGATIYLTPPKDEQRLVDTRNYQLGQRAVASVGEPVVSVRRYTAGDRAVRAIVMQDIRQACRRQRTTTSTKTLVRGKKDETKVEAPAGETIPCTSAPLSYLQVEAGRMLRVAGGFQEGATYYYLLPLDTPEGTLFLATDVNGYLKRDRYAAWRGANEENVVTQVGIPLAVVKVDNPLYFDTPIVRYETEEVVVPESPEFVHYELLYAGTSYDYRGRIWHLLYKEYRRDPPGAPIYTKRMDYTDVGSAIDLLGLRIQIHDAGDSYLSYTVVRD